MSSAISANPASPILTFYAANTPNGQKISIYLQEAGLPYRQVDLDLDKGEQKRPEYLAINPNGKIPALVDHGEGITVFESGAILSYLSSRYGALHPADRHEQWQVQQWLHFQIGGIGPMLGQLWWFRHGSRTGNREAIERYTKEAHRLYGVVDRQLSRSGWLALDRYTIADIAAFPWLRTHDELQLDIGEYRHVLRWLDRIAERPAVQRGLAALRRPTAAAQDATQHATEA
ncbi:glutathione S-transferase [Cupriavidus gilardii]|uniref:glutathione S-transferase family protein n=1 Tax=Cupriavidus gilardii TaxID=82541 RepID=UPI001EE53192|nr:glutathione S-transferase N-terminal domain-containing protein [Cupriavidus gilardii]MCG5261581.1 glutathione binding-like protein [Cupriavidus gilardii]MDF9431548.1 glutathione S-transferase [Cupriavidus gilardii]